MAYIRKMKNKEGRIYVYLVEGYRENGKVKSRILEKYGYLDVTYCNPETGEILPYSPIICIDQEEELKNYGKHLYTTEKIGKKEV